MKNWWYYHKWYVLCGIILFFILGSEFFINYRLIHQPGKEGKA